MTKLCSALFALSVIAACHHDKPAKAPGSGDSTTAMAGDSPDPTLPSWAPPSCKQYHVSVVKLTGCTMVAQDVRDSVTAKYDADNKAWHDLTNAQQSDLDRIGGECAASDTELQGKLAPCAGAPASASR